MISDVLSDAVSEVDRYLEWRDNHGARWYGGESRARIVAIRDQMDALRAELDAAPEEATGELLERVEEATEKLAECVEGGVSAFARTLARQEGWIEARFGEKAAALANYGWGSDEHGIATKVYGHGVLETAIDGPHRWLPFEETPAS